MKKTWKKIGTIALDVLIVIIFLITVFIVIGNIASDKTTNQPNLYGHTFFSVQSDSMSGTFEVGSLVIGKLAKEDTEIKKDDIVSFYQKVNGVSIINTHRVVDVQEINGTKVYQTQGDNRVKCPNPDPELKTIHEIVSVYTFSVPFVGGFIDFLKTPVGFVLILVLPLVGFMGWQIYKLISLYLSHKKEKMLAEAKAGVSAEAKDAIIKEYLAEQEAQKQAIIQEYLAQQAEQEKLNGDNTSDKNK